MTLHRPVPRGHRAEDAVHRIAEGNSLLDVLVEAAQATPSNGVTTWDDVSVRRAVAVVAAELDGLWALTLRNVTRAGHGTVNPAAASAFKLTFAEVGQHLGDLSVEVLGPAAATRSDHVRKGAHRLMDAATSSFAYSIAAGTSQIQRDIIAIMSATDEEESDTEGPPETSEEGAPSDDSAGDTTDIET